MILSYVDYDIQKGVTYRYQVRGRNKNGWGEFSDAGYLFAASAPSRPEKPTMTLVDDTTIDLQFYTPEDTGGSDVTAYELVMDGGELNTVFTAVATYGTNGIGAISELTHQLTMAADSLTQGKIYGFKFRARNAVSWGDYSLVTRIGLGDYPPAINSLAEVEERNSQYSVTMAW